MRHSRSRGKDSRKAEPPKAGPPKAGGWRLEAEGWRLDNSRRGPPGHHHHSCPARRPGTRVGRATSHRPPPSTDTHHPCLLAPTLQRRAERRARPSASPPHICNSLERRAVALPSRPQRACRERRASSRRVRAIRWPRAAPDQPAPACPSVHAHKRSHVPIFGTPYSLHPHTPFKIGVASPAPTVNWSADLHRPIGGWAKHEFRMGVRL